jgi:hypothetical protein
VSKGKKIIMVAAVCAGMVAAPASAEAGPVTATASGSVGSIDVMINGRHTLPLHRAVYGGRAGQRRDHRRCLRRHREVRDERDLVQPQIGRKRGSAGHWPMVHDRGAQGALRAHDHGPHIGAQCVTTATGGRGSIELGRTTGISCDLFGKNRTNH